MCRETRFGRQNGIVWFRPRHSADSINPHADDDGSGVAVEGRSEKERDVLNAGRFRAGTGVRAARADADGESIACGPGTGKTGERPRGRSAYSEVQPCGRNQML